MKQAPVAVDAGLDADRAVKQWLGDPDWMFKTGLGGMLTAACLLVGLLDLQHLLFLPVALAIASILCGYLLRVVRQRINDPAAQKIADWNDWPDLFMSGVTWIAIQFCICIFLAAIVGTTAVITYYAFITPHANTLAILEASLISVLLMLFWTNFLTTYLWVNFAVEERVGAAFALRKVTLHIRKDAGIFFLAWALTCAVQTAAIIIPIFTVVGIFLVPSTFFAGQLISAHLLAQAWRAPPSPKSES